MTCPQSYPFKARQIAKKYAEEVILPLFISMKKKNMNLWEDYGLNKGSIMEIKQPREYCTEDCFAESQSYLEENHLADSIKAELQIYRK